MSMVQINLRIPAGVLEDLEQVRGSTKRNPWLVAAIERAVSEAKDPTRREQAGPGSVSSSESVRPAPPANLTRARSLAARRAPPGRSSSEVKRSVKPRPKGK